MAALQIIVDDTPNPHAMKFTVGVVLNPGPTRSYRDAAAAADDPLAAALFALKPVVSVMVVNDFVTVNKKPSARWKALQPKIEQLIREHLDS